MGTYRLVVATVLIAVFAAGCAAIPKRRLELNSNPPGAEVKNIQGESLGQTPLVLEGEALDKQAQNGRIDFLLTRMNYMPRELVLDLHGEDIHTVELTKLDDAYYSQRLIKEFAQQNNEMLRELLRIQGLLIVRKLDEAEKDLNTFTKKYPSVAAAYVMLANVAQLRGKRAAAGEFLLRAQSLDPTDPVVDRMMRQSGATKQN